MNTHETIDINLNNNIIPVDKELANIILKLNSLGFETSGCCIGENKKPYKKDYAWIIFQEIDESKMLNLINCLSNYKCAYLLEKQFYIKHKDKTIYTQYILRTPDVNIKNKIVIINNWENALKNFNIETNKFTYCEMKTLFK